MISVILRWRQNRAKWPGSFEELAPAAKHSKSRCARLGAALETIARTRDGAWHSRYVLAFLVGGTVVVF